MKEGLLYKQTEILKHWNPRYFTLDESFLHYYHHIDDPLPRRSLQIIKDVQIKSIYEQININGNVCYQFIISHPETSIEYILATETEEERLDWISKLQLIRDRSIDAEFNFLFNSNNDNNAINDNNNNMNNISLNEKKKIDMIQSQDLNESLNHLSTDKVDRIDSLAYRLISLVSLQSILHWQSILQKESFSIHRSDFSNLLFLRSEITLPYSILNIFNFLVDPNKKKLIDLSIKSIDRIDEINPHTWFEYLTFHPTSSKLSKSSTDCVLLTHWRLTTNGTLLLFSFSDFNKKYPQINGIIREKISLEGYILEVTNQGTKIIYYSEVIILYYIIIIL